MYWFTPEPPVYKSQDYARNPGWAVAAIPRGLPQWAPETGVSNQAGIRAQSPARALTLGRGLADRRIKWMTGRKDAKGR